jgi:predicted ester cyclase
MTVEENKQIVRQAIERVFNVADPQAIEALYAVDFVNHTPPSQPDLHGIEGVKRHAALWHAAFPDMQCSVDDEIAEGDRVMTRWTHARDAPGDLPRPAADRPVSDRVGDGGVAHRRRQDR